MPVAPFAPAEPAAGDPAPGLDDASPCAPLAPDEGGGGDAGGEEGVPADEDDDDDDDDDDGRESDGLDDEGEPDGLGADGLGVVEGDDGGIGGCGGDGGFVAQAQSSSDAAAMPPTRRARADVMFMMSLPRSIRPA